MLDVRASRELQAALLGMKRAQRQVRLDINREARRAIRPAWIAALTQRARHNMDRHVILPGATASVTATRVAVKAANSRRPLSGGLDPAVRDGGWPAVEFGMRNRRMDISRADGVRYKAVVGRGLPNRQKTGRVAFDAASEVGTKLVRIWIETLVDGFAGFSDITPRS